MHGTRAWAAGALLLAGVLASGFFVSSPAHAQTTDPSSEKTIEELLKGDGSAPPSAPSDPIPVMPPPSTSETGGPANDSTGAATPAPPLPIVPLTPTGEPPPPEISPLQQPVEIKWRLQNSFRFFTDPADTEIHRATFLALTPEQRKTPVLSAEHALSRRHDEGWAETMYRKTCWNDAKNRYVCPDRVDYINPENHEVIVTLSGATDASVDCNWLTTPHGGESPRGDAISKPCTAPIEVDVPYPGGMTVSVSVGGREIASTEIKVRDILIVGMGDSFGSGEGNPDVPVRFSHERATAYGKEGRKGDLAGYPARVGPWKQVGDKSFIDENARWLDQACHRSLYSFEMRTALQLAVEDPHRAVTYAGFACSGAEVTFGLFLHYKGNEWVPNPPDLSQISAAADAQCGRRDAPVVDMPEAYHMNGVIPELKGGVVLSKCPYEEARKIDLVLLSIGGNDIGFARLVANAVLADDALVRSLGGWFGQVHGNKESEELLSRLDQRYKAMNRAVHGILHVPWNESDRIILAGYPPFALLDDRGSVCPDGNAGMEVFDEFNITEKSALSSAWLADKLDQVMEQSAGTHGWSFVDGHRKSFIGRGLCAGHTNGSGTVADDLRLPRKKGNVWIPYNPAFFQPYAQRKRWFRTPNDAFMTGNFHVAGSVMQKVLKLQSLSWFQILLASTYSGAFHPSAEGHAAIADAVAERARSVLTKYGQQSDMTSSGAAETTTTAGGASN
jgi:hypothetical protein